MLDIQHGRLVMIGPLLGQAPYRRGHEENAAKPPKLTQTGWLLIYLTTVLR